MANPWTISLNLRFKIISKHDIKTIIYGHTRNSTMFISQVASKLIVWRNACHDGTNTTLVTKFCMVEWLRMNGDSHGFSSLGRVASWWSSKQQIIIEGFCSSWVVPNVNGTNSWGGSLLATGMSKDSTLTKCQES